MLYRYTLGTSVPDLESGSVGSYFWASWIRIHNLFVFVFFAGVLKVTDGMSRSGFGAVSQRYRSASGSVSKCHVFGTPLGIVGTGLAFRPSCLSTGVSNPFLYGSGSGQAKFTHKKRKSRK